MIFKALSPLPEADCWKKNYGKQPAEAAESINRIPASSRRQGIPFCAASYNLQFASTDLTPLADLQTTIAARQKLESQQEENRAVQKEFKNLSSDSNIYKLVGPVLLKQDKDDAKRTVDGRLEFIEKEIKRIEGTIKELQEKGERVRNELGALQQQIQMEQQGGTGKGPSGK